jgi:hypothetical protein
MPTATRTRAPRGYRYSQLGPKGKAAAREWYRNQEWGDDDGMEDLLSNDLSDHYGLTNCEVMYSLDNCQGDGVVFKGNPDLEEWADHDETLRDLITEMKGLAALLGFEPPRHRRANQPARALHPLELDGRVRGRPRVERQAAA